MEHVASNQIQQSTYTVEAVEGRFRPIAAMQLSLSWWLYHDGHISRRQLRVYFALHEMAERRRYIKADGGGRKRKPNYLVEEIASLVGGRGSTAALDALRADVRKLAKIGLAQMSEHAIAFAKSPDQTTVDDLTGFWTFWDKIPNRTRSVPVPRRTLRALAAGFTKAVTGTVVALSIRSIHWHKREGDFRVDGRTKGSWISDAFGLSRRAVTDARAHLIAIGWLKPLQTPQVLLNRYGNHDVINVAWSHRDSIQQANNDPVGFASPGAQNPSEFASPIKNRLPSSTKKTLENRNSEMVSNRKDKSWGDRERNPAKESQAVRKKLVAKPNLRAIHSEHLRDTGALLELYGQAVKKRLIEDGDRGRLDFIAFAERARSRGHNPGALFSWLLRNRKFEFITQADEDAASRRTKEYLRPNQPRSSANDGEPISPAYAEADRVVRTSSQTARKFKVRPFTIAQKTQGWTLEQWEMARENFELRFGRLDR